MILKLSCRTLTFILYKAVLEKKRCLELVSLSQTDFIVWLPLFCDSRDLDIMYIVTAY